MKSYKFQHVSLLELAANDLYTGQKPDATPVVNINDKDMYLIVAIPDS